MENFLNNNEVFTLDLSAFKSHADVIFEISQFLDDDKAFGKKICIKLSDIDLSQDQLLSLKSLISSINSSLSYIESESKITIASAQAIGIETPNNPPVNTDINQSITTEENKDSEFSEAEIEAKKYINMEMLENATQALPQTESENTLQDNKDTNIQTQLFDNVPANSGEQVLEDFNSHEPEEENIYNQENEYQQKLDIFDSVQTEENNTNVLENIEQSVEFDEIAQNTNVQQNEEVQDALTGIFASEQKLESIFDKQGERTTIDLAEPLDNTYTEEDAQIDKMSVKYVKQTVRSGNVVSSEGNLVIIGDCHPGSEIHAAGDITVWGMLGGIAHAGNKGNKKAKVRALKLNPIQLRIANLYSRRPDSLHSIYAEKTSTFTPEEARILRDEIIIYTLNEK